ncbi:MAG TPA: hypothetical protein VMV69_19440 [Pirellulales bacterium]|nr:hypothetical protein [Pirellulales bacterium]
MKYTVTLLSACTPLVALTIWSFIELALPAAGRRGALAGVDVAATTRLADDTAARCEEARSFIAQLAETDLLDARPAELAPAKSDRTKSLAGKWRQSVEARALLVKYHALQVRAVDSAAEPGQRERQAKEAVRALEQFITAERPAAQVPGADVFFDLLGRRVERLKAEIAGYDTQSSIADALGKASDEMNAGKAEACLARLDNEPLTLARDAQTQVKLQALRRRAEFRLAADRLQQRKPALPADRDLLRALEDFLHRFPEPPSEAERDRRAQLQRRRDRLKVDIAIADLAQPTDLETMLTQAALIVGDSTVDQASRDRARAHVVEWLLSSGLPRRTFPDSLLGKQEAETKNGQRKIGKFLLPPGAEQWRFWTDKRHQTERPRGDEQISRDSLVAIPATPMYVRWAREYNDLSEQLVRQGGTEEQWRAFARRCDEIDEELAAYREHWGVDEEPDKSCRDWSFRPRAATARQIVEHWSQFEQVLGK